MGLWTSLFGGTSVKTMPADPQLEQWQGALFNYKPGIGKIAKMDRRLVRNIDAGEDVSSFGALNSLRQREAAQLAGVDMDYMTGANALIGASGGEQANLLNRAREIQKQRIQEQTGMNMVDALSQLRESAATRAQQAQQYKQGMRLNAMQGALGNRLGYYGRRYQLGQEPGLFNTLANMASTAAPFMRLGRAAGGG